MRGYLAFVKKELLEQVRTYKSVSYTHLWQKRYRVQNTKGLTLAIYALAIVRIVLCLLPQNEWLNYNAPVSWGVYRNIPFAIMGLMIIYPVSYTHLDVYKRQA